MAVFDEEGVKEFIKNHEQVPTWVGKARKYSDFLKALVDGEKFQELLITKIEKLESAKREVARRKYAKDIRSLFTRLTNNRSNVFQANGGSVEINISGDEQKEDFIKSMTRFKGGKSLKQYLSEYYLPLSDTDPNGVVFLEYTTDTDSQEVYPTYKSINDIRTYVPNGQKVEAILFEPKTIPNGFLWRFVDDERDWFVKQLGGTFVIDEDLSFDHPFKSVPAVILSPIEKVGTLQRLSWLNPVLQDGQNYAQKKSIHTIYEFQKGTPIHWRMGTINKGEIGVERTGEGGDASPDAKGVTQNNDVTDVVNVPLPREGDPKIDKYAGFISPDLDFLEYSEKSMVLLEGSMKNTLWGTEEQTKNTETATGRYIDVQPIHNVLNDITDTVEWVHNQIGDWIVNFVVRTSTEEEKLFHISYGRRYLLEDQDTVLKRYEKAKTDGDPTSILDKLLEEWVLTKYKTDPFMQQMMVKKIRIEPYVHWDIKTVSELFGANEAYTKVLFNDWWKVDADPKDPFETLNAQFKTKTNDKSSYPVQVEGSTEGGIPD